MPAPFEELMATLQQSAWLVRLDSPQNKQPVLLTAMRNNTTLQLRVYIWNVRPGGGPPGTRPEAEYRIQVMKTPLEFGSGYFTLLLGWDADHEVFVAWDAGAHVNAGYSSSVQVRAPYIERAQIYGMAIQHREQPDENVVVVTPDLLSSYLEQASILHGRQLNTASATFPELDTYNIQEAEAEGNTAQTPDDVNSIPRTNAPRERRQAVTNLTRWWRSSTFPRAVTWAYGYECSTCGIGLNLVEAAHIIPIAHPEAIDHPTNGLALCPLHHDAYDSGIYGVTEDFKILINDAKLETLAQKGLAGGIEKFLDITPAGDRIALPTYAPYRPDPELLRRGLILRGFR